MKSDIIFFSSSTEPLTPVTVSSIALKRFSVSCFSLYTGLSSASREANLAGNLLDSSLNVAAALLKSVEVDVESLRKLAKSKAIALDSRLNAVGILVVLQLSANSIELSLSFDALCSNARAVSVPEAEASIAE